MLFVWNVLLGDWETFALALCGSMFFLTPEDEVLCYRYTISYHVKTTLCGRDSMACMDSLLLQDAFVCVTCNPIFPYLTIRDIDFTSAVEVMSLS